MEILAKLNERDNAIVELYSINKKYLIGVIHVDHFNDMDPEIYRIFDQGREVALEIEIKGGTDGN